MTNFAQYVETFLHENPEDAQSAKMTTTEAILTSYIFAAGVISTVGMF